MIDQADIHRRVCGRINERQEAIQLLKQLFSDLPNKDLAWQDIIQLIHDDDLYVRSLASDSLESTFCQIPNKSRAWHDLHKLAQEKDNDVLCGVARAIGSAFAHIPERVQALQDLNSLTQNEDIDVVIYAYYSLGKISLVKAVEAKDIDNLVKELKTAISYFEISFQKRPWYSPAKFCLPFYRSYFAITFQDTKGDVIERYLKEAKAAVGFSESRAELLIAIESLARALQESQKLKVKSFDDLANELNVYRRYCDKAAEHMAAAEESAPGAVKLMRKCNPLLEEKIQATITEIQKKAKQICQTAHGTSTEYEAPGAEMYNAAKDLSAADLVSMQRSSSRIVNQLKKFCKLLPENEKGLVCEVIEEIGHAADFPDKLQKIELALTYVSPAIGKAIQIEEETKVINKDVLARLDDINFQLQSGNVAQSLRDLKSALDELNSIKSNMDQMGQSIEDIGVNQRRLIKKLEKNMPMILGKLEIIARRQQDPRINKILKELQEMKKSPAETALDQVVALISIIGFLLQIMPK